MNLYSIIFHSKSYTIFKIAKIVLTVTNVTNRGTFACRTVTTIENRDINATFFWNIQIFYKFGTYKSMDIWTEYSNIRIYGGKICTYKCAPNQEHTNQWFNGWNTVTHRYMAQSSEHINVQQKVTFKNMVSRMEYSNIHIYLFLECRFISYRHQIDEYNLSLCVFPYSELCQIEYLD
ncbi:predicted protein [Candida tropicalis MYA-3404]|uniref:Uncharacterized protein n=1 Tax=Candida tropicalis (strain ATCC MYA-3404 / T1) TaxID=294747 RepID=C5MCW2_CANTT|nr:predicted protein [Candida tropicalis MYA-3404]EER32392.1 predicted protein [Candida tropicalis MYA-3404]KAG4406002.1 hypothetical protein JTP64_004873 [Candida tropicalis]